MKEYKYLVAAVIVVAIIIGASVLYTSTKNQKLVKTGSNPTISVTTAASSLFNGEQAHAQGTQAQDELVKLKIRLLAS